MKWWRVELDSKGAIVSCTAVLGPTKSTRLLTFVQGETKEQASDNALDWHKRFKAQQLASKQRRDARRREAGLCTYCGLVPAREGKKTCGPCSKRKYGFERSWRERGCVPKYKPADPVIVRQRYELSHNATLHAPSVLKHFDELGPELFRRWLLGIIEERRARALRTYSSPVAEAAE